MNYTSLTLAFVFVAVAMPFLAKAKRETDPAQQRNKRLAGILMLIAAAAFFVSFAVSAVADR